MVLKKIEASANFVQEEGKDSLRRLDHVFRTILFLSGLTILMGAVSWMFLPKDNTPESGIEDVLTSAYLAEPQKSLDVVVLGDSVPKFCVMPTVLWHEQGIPAFVCASAGNSVPKILELAENIFQRQSPKILILETNLVFRWIQTGTEARLQAERIFPVLRYHDNWKFVRPWQMLRPISYTWRAWEKGYYLCKLIEPAEERDYMRPSDSVEPIAKKNADYVRALQTLCLEHNCQLILCSMPSATNMDYARHNALAQLGKALGVPYLDMNMDDGELNLDWRVDTADGGDHLNYWGAKKVTGALGKMLVNTGLLTDHRGEEAYAEWDVCYENLQAVVHSMRGNVEDMPED